MGDEMSESLEQALRIISHELAIHGGDMPEQLRIAIARRLLAEEQKQEPVAWLPLTTAPMWVYGRDALVGEYAEGFDWKKVAIWEPAWSRDDCIARGATHWWPHLRDLPSPATVPVGAVNGWRNSPRNRTIDWFRDPTDIPNGTLLYLAAPPAQNAKLGRLLELAKEGNDLLDNARSGYIGGCGEDLKWDARREEFRADYRAELEKNDD